MKLPEWLDGWAAIALAMGVGLWLFLAFLVPPLGIGILLLIAGFVVIERTRQRWFRNAVEIEKHRRFGATQAGAVFLESSDTEVVWFFLPGSSGASGDPPMDGRGFALADTAATAAIPRLLSPTTLGVLALRPYRDGVVGVWPGDRRVLVHPRATPADLAEVRPHVIVGGFAPMSEADLIALSRVVPQLPSLYVLIWAPDRVPAEAQVLRDLGARVQIIEAVAQERPD